MQLISHRGNLVGPNPGFENSPEYILSAASQGFDVEVDVRTIEGNPFLGHNAPQHEVTWEFLKNPALWCHAKDIESLNIMISLGIHCFWHQNDDVTITSKGFIWTFPGKRLTTRSICVLPETIKEPADFSKCCGVCSDFIIRYEELK